MSEPRTEFPDIGRILPMPIPDDREDERLAEEMRAAEEAHRSKPWDNRRLQLYVAAANALYDHRRKQRTRRRT